MVLLACIELIERKATGIVDTLNEESRLPKGSDNGMVNKLASNHKRNTFFGMKTIILFTFFF